MNVSDLLPVINLPWEGTEQVEVYVFPLNKKDNNTNEEENISDIERIERIQGALSKYANPDLIPLEKDAWAKHCEEKYGNVGH